MGKGITDATDDNQRDTDGQQATDRITSRDDRSASTIDKRSQDDSAGVDAFAAAGNEPADANFERKRKPRAAGTARVKQARPKTLDLNKEARAGFVKKVVGIHALVDTYFGTQGLFAIEEKEGEQLVEACTDVMNQYDISINPKVAAWINLGAVLTAVYAPKYMIFKAIMAEHKQRANAPSVSPHQTQESAAGLVLG